MTALRRRLLEDMQVRHLSPHTQRASVKNIAQVARHFGQSPVAWGPEEIRTRPGSQDAVIEHQVDPRSRRQRSEALQEFYRIEEQMGGPVRPGASQLKSDLAVFGPVEAVLRHRRAQGVAGDPLQAVPLVGRHADAGM